MELTECDGRQVPRLLDVEGLDDGHRVRKARGLDQHVVEARALGAAEVAQHAHQVAADAAAEAAVV